MGSDISIYSEGLERYLKCLNHFQACKQKLRLKMVLNQVLEHRIQEEPTSLKKRGGVNIKHIPLFGTNLTFRSKINEKHKNREPYANHQLSKRSTLIISLSHDNNFRFQIHYVFHIGKKFNKRMQTYQGATRWCDHAE